MICLFFKKIRVLGIGAPNRIGQEMLWLPYAGCFLYVFGFLTNIVFSILNKQISCQYEKDYNNNIFFIKHIGKPIKVY